jgi:hypothetical protein
MATDASAGSPAPPTDDLVFAAQDLRRDRTRPVPTFDDPVTFAAAPRPADVAAAAVHAARRQADGGRPAAPPAPAAASAGFQVYSSAASPAAAPPAELPWTVRQSAPAMPSRRGWSARQSGAIERSATETISRLREDAVDVSWKSAWIAVSSAQGRAVRNPDY